MRVCCLIVSDGKAKYRCKLQKDGKLGMGASCLVEVHVYIPTRPGRVGHLTTGDGRLQSLTSSNPSECLVYMANVSTASDPSRSCLHTEERYLFAAQYVAVNSRTSIHCIHTFVYTCTVSVSSPVSLITGYLYNSNRCRMIQKLRTG